MNKKTIFTIIAIVALIAGIGLGVTTDIANDLPAIALTAFGLGGLVIQTYNKSEKKGAATLASIILMVICGLAAAFAEMSQDNLSKLISAVVAVVTLLPVTTFDLLPDDQRTPLSLNTIASTRSIILIKRNDRIKKTLSRRKV